LHLRQANTKTTAGGAVFSCTGMSRKKLTTWQSLPQDQIPNMVVTI
jgi:hypothetical protein